MRIFIITVALAFVAFFNEGKASNLGEFKIQQKIQWDKNFYVVTSDNAIWEIFWFELRSQTWTEWWHNVPVRVSDELIWDEKCWLVGDGVNIENNDIGDLIADSFEEKDKIKYRCYPFLLKNSNSNKTAFIRPVAFEALVKKLLIFADEQYSKGYNSGYSTGYSTGSNSSYNSGYTNGYNAGYSYGYNLGFMNGSCR